MPFFGVDNEKPFLARAHKVVIDSSDTRREKGDTAEPFLPILLKGKHRTQKATYTEEGRWRAKPNQDDPVWTFLFGVNKPG